MNTQMMNAHKSLTADTLLTGFLLQPPVAESVLGQLIRRSLVFFKVWAEMEVRGGISNQ